MMPGTLRNPKAGYNQNSFFRLLRNTEIFVSIFTYQSYASNNHRLERCLQSTDLKFFYNFHFKICVHTTGKGKNLGKCCGIQWLILIGSHGHVTLGQILVANATSRSHDFMILQNFMTSSSKFV